MFETHVYTNLQNSQKRDFIEVLDKSEKEKKNLKLV